MTTGPQREFDACYGMWQRFGRLPPIAGGVPCDTTPPYVGPGTAWLPSIRCSSLVPGARGSAGPVLGDGQAAAATRAGMRCGRRYDDWHRLLPSGALGG